MKNIFTLIVSLGIILFTLVPATVGHTNPDSVETVPFTDDILRSKTAFAVVEGEIARHLNLSVLSEWDYQKLRGPVLWKIRAPIHFHLREKFGRIIHTVDFGPSAGSGSPSQTSPMDRGEKPHLRKRASEIIRDFINQEHISTIIRSDAPIGVGEIAAIRRVRGEVRYTYDIINGACVVIPIKHLVSLIRCPFITEMWPDGKGNLLSNGLAPIGALKVHSAYPSGLGVTGKGVHVAVVDGGIDSNHPEFKGRLIDTRGVAFFGGFDSFKDHIDHGTHVAGIIGAVLDGNIFTGVAPEVELLDAQVDLNEDTNRFTLLGQNDYGDAMDAIKWAAHKKVLHSNKKADIINMSLGWPIWVYGRNGDDPMSELIDEVVNAGVVFIVAAGNEAQERATGEITAHSSPNLHPFTIVSGSKTGRAKIIITLIWDTKNNDLDLALRNSNFTSRTNPAQDGRTYLKKAIHGTSKFYEQLELTFNQANSPYRAVLQVEASNVQDPQEYEVWVSAAGDSISRFDTPNSSDETVGVPAYSKKAITVGAVDHSNQVTNFSSQGPSNADLIKPEIVAPGFQIYSTVGSPDYYGEMSGTSMAAPHVAGVAALILDAVGKNDHDKWNFNPDEVKSAIVRGAEAGVGSIPNSPDNIYGAGLVKADNIIFGKTVEANKKIRFEIIPRLTDLRYGSYTLNADPALKVAISWENPAHDLDLVLSDAANGKTLPMVSQVASNSVKIGGDEFIFPSPGATYFLDVINKSQEPVTFTGAATHKIIEAPDLIVESVTVDKSNLAPSENFTLSITVGNQGSGESSATTLRYYKWDEIAEEWKHIPDKTSDIESLSTDDTSSQSISLTAPNSAGPHYYSACVDEVTNESNTSNNCAKYATITVEQPVQTSTDAPIFVYWADSGTGKIQRANLDGSNIQDIVTGLDDPYSIALDGTARKIYWTDYRRKKIQRANLDGSNIQDIVTRLGFPYGIALDVAAGRVYWTDEGPDKIQRANLDGSNIQDVFIVRGLGNPKSIALDVAAGKMYWTTAWTEKIQRANLNGTNVQDLVTPRLAGLGGPSDIALDVAAGKMYWMNPFNHKIQRANLNGTNIETLVSSGRPYGIALDVAAGKMYWTNWHTDKIQRANLDGSNVEDFVTTGLVSPTGIALGIPTPKGPDLLVTSLKTGKSNLAPSENFTLSATVENQGTVESSATTLRYYKWDEIAEEWKHIPDKTNPVAVLSVNGTSTKDLTLTAPNTAGEHFYKVCVDAIPGEADPDPNCYESWVTITVQQQTVPEDVNGDGSVNILDLVRVDSHFGETGENDADVNEDGIVNIADLLLVAKAIGEIGEIAAAPSANTMIPDILTTPQIQQWLTKARGLDNSPDYQRGIGVLEQLLAILMPEETRLLPNYPNPFNPETWVPYQLAESAEVHLTIYAVDGTVVRTLVLGHQTAGNYQNRERAAYWDGKNALGESVASGLYFYTLTAGDFTATRQMLIRK